LLGVPPLGGYNYITPHRAGMSATAELSCFHRCYYARDMYSEINTLFYTLISYVLCGVASFSLVYMTTSPDASFHNKFKDGGRITETMRRSKRYQGDLSGCGNVSAHTPDPLPPVSTLSDF